MSGSGPSGPSSPASIASMEKDIDNYMGNGLTLEGPPFGLEKIYDYEPGGHHPIHLGDRLGKDDRYCVIHKLGNGGSANVWLCRDLECETPKYVGLKILMAEASADDCRELHVLKLKEMRLDQEVGGKYICLPLDHFRIDGPNGSHICFVYPVLGPRVSCILKESENPEKVLRKVAFQALQGMVTLHSHKICHGDFTPANILLGISGLDGLTENQVLQILGEPKQIEVMTESGESPTEPTAPKYLVHPVDFSKVNPQFITDQVCIIDFGESFEVSDPPEDLGIPEAYCSPELILDKIAGIGSDLWALGCTLFEIRTGRKLFDMFDDDMDSHLYYMVLLLGKLPEPWWTAWEARQNWFEIDSDPQALRRKCFPATEKPDQEGTGDVLHPIIPSEPRSIQETLASGLWYMDMDIRDEIHRDIPGDEIEVFADLLGKLLKYIPKDRLTASAAQDHEWFRM